MERETRRLFAFEPGKNAIDARLRPESLLHEPDTEDARLCGRHYYSGTKRSKAGITYFDPYECCGTLVFDGGREH
jgi:hypothetical protein